MDYFSHLDNIFQSHDGWKSLFGEVPCGYLLTDPKGRIHTVNDTLLDWLQYDRNEMENKLHFQDLIPLGEKIFYESRHAVMLKLQNQVNELNYNLIGNDGIRRPMLVNSARRLNQIGEIIGLQFVIFSFSERKKYEEELLNAKKQSEEVAAAKSNFLSIVSHEVRTPIHAILNSIEILIQDTFSAEQNELLAVIHHSSSNLIDFVNSVLNITKMEVGNRVAIKEPFCIEYLLKQLLAIYHSFAQKKNVDFILNIPENIPNVVIGDKDSIRQILTNLIGNAIKFTSKGKIELNVNLLAISEETCTLQFVLKDSGIGISKDELNNIFEPFTQANQSIHQQFGGTGLGLSISKQLLHLLDSEMKVESELGKGSTFMFELIMPISKELVRNNESFKVSVQLDQFRHIKILLVDDTYSNILIIKRYFEMWNIPFEHVFSGTDAIITIQKQNFDLVLMDINMPEMDGYETTKMIRSLEGKKFQQIPIIALSAFKVSEIKFKVKRSGMNDILHKPFKAIQLFETITKWTPTQKMPDETSLDIKKELVKKQRYDYLSLNKICEFFDDDPAVIKDYLKTVLNELKVSIKEFTIAKEQYSQDIYCSVTHKNASNISMFNLHILKEKMSAGEEFLKNGQNELFVEQCNDIILFFQQFIDWIQKQIDNGVLLYEK